MNAPAIQQLAIEIRHAGPSDEAFVFSTWLQSFKRSAYEVRRIRDAVYFAHHHALIERMLTRSATLIAHPAGDPGTILGYVVGERTAPREILHWVYVKLPWRRLGIASRLIEEIATDPNHARFTHWSVWSLAVPAPKGVDRGDRKAIREARTQAVRNAEKSGEAGGDTEDLLRKWPRMEYDPYLKYEA